TQRDDRSEISGFSYGTKSYQPPGSEYIYPPPSRQMSQMELPRYGSRLSLAPSDVMGRGYDEQSLHVAEAEGMPSDDALLGEIREILKTADLMTVTKKGIKQELERRFGVNLEPRKAYIGSATEAVLSGQL
ncbi:MAG: hypothetical protein LQ341_007465, partial [Variospora aurantia]